MRQLSRGMTLIEVLVAFVLLSLSLGVIFHIFAGGIRNAQMADGYSRAVFFAESKLAAVGVEQTLGTSDLSGVFEPNLHWRVTVTPADDGRNLTAGTPQTQRLYHVRVQVGWSEGGRERQVELTSLRLGTRT